MEIRSVKKYRTVKMWTLFQILFKINEDVYFSSSYRTDNTTCDWVAVFNSEGKFIGEMNRDYFYGLEKGYIQESTL